jgi:quercetin dioxygenase-like cupin family protein
MDALKTAPDVYSLIMENERVRVLDLRLKPGEKALMHSHPDHVVYVLKDGNVKITLPDGKSTDFNLKAGQAIWMEAGQHAAENIGKTEANNLVIELKK